MIKPELLAPAGSIEALHAAVDNGADAVYLGIGSYNARANAQNFTIEDLPAGIEYAHLHSVRVYLALNTLLRDDELADAAALAQESFLLGVDAVIVQDIGLLNVLNDQFPDIPIHASTQMNLYDFRSISWAKDNNISRIVLPRELSFEEIERRTKEAANHGIEVEVFIHGALCVSYSGLCLFSAMNGNGQRSGNRGLCAQPCRTLFELQTEEGGADSCGRLLSVKDQSALPYISKLMKAGVHSLKIEGRMKDAAYVAAVVRAYREYIDTVIEGADSLDTAPEIARHLLLAFNRGGSFTTQYLQAEKHADLPAGKYSGRFGLLLGIIVNKNARAGTLSLRPFSDKLPVRGDYLSIRTNDQETASFPIGKIEKMGGLLVVMGLHPQMIDKITDGSNVYQMSETSYTRDLLKGKASFKTKISIRLQNDTSVPTKIQMQISVLDGMWKGVSAAVSIAPSAAPASSETSEHSAALTSSGDFGYLEIPHSRICEQLSKSKSSPFDVVSVDIDSSLQLKTPVSFVNELRREGFLALESEILHLRHPLKTGAFPGADLERKTNSKSMPHYDDCADNGTDNNRLKEIIHANYFDLRRILPQKLGVRADYYSFSVYDLQNSMVHSALIALHEEEPFSKFLIWLPGAFKDSLLLLIENAVRYMQNTFPDTYAGIITANPADGQKTSWISAFANLYNGKAISSILSAGVFAAAPSYELKDQNLVEILSGIPSELFSGTYLSLHRYGRIEWMQSEFCPAGKHEKDCQKCRAKERCFSLLILSPDDSKPIHGKDLPVVTHAGPCTAEVLGPLHKPAGPELLSTCRKRHIPIAHTLRFLDEPYDVRRHTANEILAELSRTDDSKITT